MDCSGNKQLSLAEIDLGILNYLGHDFHMMKPGRKKRQFFLYLYFPYFMFLAIKMVAVYFL